MKTINRFFMVIAVMLLLINASTFAQDQERPAYVVVTKMHWNTDNKDFKMDEWKAMEKEIADKVTRKNEYIMSSGYYMHNMTPDNTELLYVTTYPSWDAIDKAAARNQELAEAAWPDKAKRDDFYKKRNANYADMHSDEIYATMPGAKDFKNPPTKDMIVYLRVSHFAFPEDGTQKEFDELNDKYVKNVLHKNEFIKAYYPNAHAYGSDRTEFLEAYYLDSFSDIDKMFEKNTELFNAQWKDEAARKSYGEKIGKYFTGTHGDYIYTYVSGI